MANATNGLQSASSRFALEERFVLQNATAMSPHFPASPAVESANRLASSLWVELPIARMAHRRQCGDIDFVIGIASASHSQVVGWYAELQAFVRSMCRAAVELRGKSEVTGKFRDDLTSEIVEQMAEKIQWPIYERSFVDFRFAALDAVTAFHEAETKLEAACLKFANDFFSLLDQLQRQNLVGKLESTASSCRFSFAIRASYLRGDAMRTEVNTRSEPGTFRDGGQRLYRDTFAVTQFHIEHRQGIHFHHVRNPTRSRFDLARYPVPERFRALIETCPQWLRPSLEILEGELFREEHIEWDVATEVREERKLVESRRSRDPAILFGDYVLAGWGETAIAGEESRVLANDLAKQRALSAQTATHFKWMAVAVGLLSVAAAGLASISSLMLPLSVLIGIGSMYLASQAALAAAHAEGDQRVSRVVVDVLLSGCTTFTAVTFVYTALHFSWMSIGIGAAFAIATWLLFSLKLHYEESKGSRV